RKAVSRLASVARSSKISLTRSSLTEVNFLLLFWTCSKRGVNSFMIEKIEVIVVNQWLLVFFSHAFQCEFGGIFGPAEADFVAPFIADQKNVSLGKFPHDGSDADR